MLLSFLHQVTADTLNAVRAALRDCIEVQHVAIQTIDRYRDIDDDEGLLLQLFEDLLDDSPAVGFATAQVLSAIARNLYLSPNLRERIIEAMVKAIDDERSQRSVYLFSKREVTYQNYVYEIKYKGQLDEILYGMVTRLSGVTDFRDR